MSVKLFPHEQNEKLVKTVKFDMKFCYQHKMSHSIFIIIVKQICFFIEIYKQCFK